MPDSITPVGAEIQPPNPMQGINTLSGIYGLQQQRLGIQQQQQALQGQAAQVQQEQQKNQELKAARQLVVQGAQQGKYQLPDGSFDRIKAANDLSQIGPYAQEMAGQILSQANEVTQNKQALQTLTVARKNEIGQTFASLAASPDLDHSKIIDSIETLRQEHPGDKDFSRLLTSMSMAVPTQADGNTLRQIMARGSAAATGTPQAGPSTLDTGGQIYPGTTNRFTGQFTPAQGGIQKTLNPAQTPGYLAQAATASGAAAGQVGTDNQVFQKVTSAGADAARGIELAQRIQQEAAGVRTGQYTQDFANRLTVLKQHDPSITDRQLLQKDAANLKSLAETTATSDAERAQIGSGFPSPETMNPDAVEKAARYWQGSFRMAGARSANALAHVTQNGSTAGLTVKDQAFMQNASPGRFAPPEPKKQLPSGAKLSAYAQAHFGGDTGKASAYLKQQGYE